MAGLQSFVRGNQPSQAAQPARSDRLLYATNAKVSARTSTVHATIAPLGTTYPPWNAPNPAPSRDTSRPSWPSTTQQPAATPQKGIFDETLSVLDETESVIFDGRPDAESNKPRGGNLARDDDYDDVETVGEDIEHRPERPTTPRGGGISGRFYQPPPSHKHGNLELRPYHNTTSSEHHPSSSKKRSRVPGPLEEARPAEAAQGGSVIPGNFDASSSGEDSMSDGPNGNRNNGGLQGGDYDDKQLESMTYQKLRDETWESETHGKASTVPLELHDPALPLGERFANCVKLDGEREETQDIQVEFFAKLPTSEWEEAGDLFIERFADIMAKLKEARKTKRRIATDFERLIDDREEAIRQRSDRLDKDLADMRKGGEGVIRGKLI